MSNSISTRRDSQALVVRTFAAELADKLHRPAEEISEKELSAYDFPASSTVRVVWPDSSNASFCYAFAVLSQDTKNIAVFTEHCGYFVFHADSVEDVIEISATSETVVYRNPDC